MEEIKNIEVEIHKKKYIVNDGEFSIVNMNLDPMIIRSGVSYCDRDIGLLKKLSSLLGLDDIFCSDVLYGGYIPINLLDYYNFVNISCFKNNRESITANISKYDTNNKIKFIKYNNISGIEYELSSENEIRIIISKNNTDINNMKKLKYFEKYVYVSNLIWNNFYKNFKFWLKEDNEFDYIFNYDNLINLLIMVKDAGDGFREILELNKEYIDKWTILDTGSTDNTINIINEVLNDKYGTLYQEPFINFRDSRNRLLELAGNECAYNLMLDDTYYVTGKLRDFLVVARGDDVADSFSLFITDTETQYSSNRITKPERGLRYKYKIHEIIEKNENLCIPINIAHINDVVNNYMQNRTINRKQKDLELLFEELNDNPEDPRILYYLAETYYCIKDWDNAFKYYNLRKESTHKGFDEEIYDSYFKMALISERYKNCSWNEVERLYLDCYEKDTEIPDPLFMIGYHYLLENNQKLAYDYFKRVMLMPKVHKNMNVRAIITNEYAPKFLLNLCFNYEDYTLGLMCSEILIKNFNNNFTYKKWFEIFKLYTEIEKEKKLIDNEIPPLKNDNKLICFVDNSGWDKWDGETLKTKGLGGSETWTIGYAETLALNENNKVIVFCNCNEPKNYNNVDYVPIKNFLNFALTNIIDICLVSRYTEYTFLCLYKFLFIKKLFLVLHDIAIDGDLIPITDKLSGILCISEWQKSQFLSYFPSFENKTFVISYGMKESEYKFENKKRYSFIYPSFPNRGLLYLLKMFPKIVERYPDAKLNVFCNLDLAYLHYAKEEIDEIRRLLLEQVNTVTNHGWVNKETLIRYWSESHILFYPCNFAETCCRVAMEAAATKTFVISNNLAALNETVGNRGAIINGDVKTEEWQKQALTNLFFVLDNNLENIFIEKNYEWIKTKNYQNVVNDFEYKFLQIDDNINNDELFYSNDINKKLNYIHSNLKLDYGSFDDEYSLQNISCKFINGTENILEIGGNIGRNSMIIGYILNKNNNSNFVSLECNLEFANKLENNKNKNNLNFSIEPYALSKRKLIQKEGELRTFVSNIVLNGYNSVNTINWEKLCKKYSFIFDTLVLDCEGAFYYILRDIPEILININKIIIKNNYNEKIHKIYVDKQLKENNFNVVYSELDSFYEVWIKNSNK